MKSSLEANIDFWKNKCESERNKSFSKRYEDIDYDMNQKFSHAIADDDTKYFDVTSFYINKNFKEFLSIVYEKNHDNRFLHLELRDMDLRYPTLVLGIDADTVICNAREIQFALFVFIEEWCPDLNFSNILLEWC